MKLHVSTTRSCDCQWVVWVLALLLSAAGTSPTVAATLTYTNSASFLADLAGMGAIVQTEDFEGVSAGTVIADGGSVGGLTFGNTNFGPYELGIDDAYATTSGNNYLGVGDTPGDVEFWNGDAFDISFASANAVGLYVITPYEVWPEEIQLSVGGSTVSFDGVAEQTLWDGSSVYFLGLIDNENQFSTASLWSDPLDDYYFAFNIDDITTATVPEPAASCIWSGLGLLGTAISLRRGRRRRIVAKLPARKFRVDS